MNRFLSALILASALPVLAQGPITWEHDLEAAKARAQREHKQIFMDVWAEWCGPCQRMQAEVFPSAEAQAALRNFVPLSALVQTRDGRDTPATRVAFRYGVQAFPSLFILDENGEVVRSSIGYLRPPAFVAFLEGKGGTP